MKSNIFKYDINHIDNNNGTTTYDTTATIMAGDPLSGGGTNPKLELVISKNAQNASIRVKNMFSRC